MDASASSDSMTDGEENHSEASPSPAATTQVSVADESPGVTVVQLSDGETVQVQGVIQAPQTSVIQSPQVQTVQEDDCTSCTHSRQQ